MLPNNLLEPLFQFEIQETMSGYFLNTEKSVLFVLILEVCSDPACNLISVKFPRSQLGTGKQICWGSVAPIQKQVIGSQQ